MRIFLVNPSDISFGIAIITPRWLYVLAAATPARFGDPVLIDETLSPFDPDSLEPGDVVGIGMYTCNALRGMEIGRMARERGAWVVYGGVHASLYPDEARQLGAAHAVVKGDGDVIWAQVLADCERGKPLPVYEGGRVGADQFKQARWDLLPPKRYMWPTVQTVRGCPKHCSFCSVWRTDGQQPRQRTVDAVISEIVQLRRMGYKLIVLADDNFYPVTLTDLAQAERQNNLGRLSELQSLREERFALMRRLAQLPQDMVFFTQITMEAAEDPGFLEAMRKAHILGVLVGVESITEEGLKTIYKDFNLTGENLIARLRTFREHGIGVCGSFIFGLTSDTPETFRATVELAKKADVGFANFITMTPFPGTVDFQKWEMEQGDRVPEVGGVPLTRYWLIPAHIRPKIYIHHPTMDPAEILVHTRAAWNDFYSLASIRRRMYSLKCLKSWKSRLAFAMTSKLYLQMYAKTGIAADSARRSRANRWARWLAKPCLELFQAKPMPDLELPRAEPVLLPILAD